MSRKSLQSRQSDIADPLFTMLFWRFVARLSVALASLLLACAVQSQVLDLGAHADQVREHLGPADKNWLDPTCPGYRVELRHQDALWLKLVYAPNARLAAAGIFRLRQSASAREETLRWPGLKPGFDSGDAYPPVQGWNPVLFNMGAKQWQWFEEAEAPLASREELLGSVVVDVASGFAGGRDFPFDIAQSALGL